MYYRKVAAYAPDWRWLCTDQMTALICELNDVIATILKASRHIRNQIPSLDANLFEEQYWEISSRSDLKQRSLMFFEERYLRKKNNKNETSIAISDQFLVHY